jgi:RNA polymerase sigma-70 factor (ECF subfamily)
LEWYIISRFTVPGEETHQITVLLRRWRSGDSEAAGELAPLVYQELRRLSRNQMRSDADRQAFQPTELVHEAYLRLFQEPLDWQDRAHFFAVAARQIRHLLIEASRSRNAEKRGGGLRRVDLTEAMPAASRSGEDAVAVHEALDVLEKLDPRSTQVLELRLFGGFNDAETAELLGITPAKARRDWDFARAWLLNRLRSSR